MLFFNQVRLLVASVLFIFAANAQAALYSQCGGAGWTGPTACVSGAVCQSENAFYYIQINVFNRRRPGGCYKPYSLTVKSNAHANAQIAMLFLFSFVAAVGWIPMQGLYAEEILRYESRSKEMAVYTLWINIAGFYNTFVTGITFTGAEWIYYFLFIVWDIFTALFIYFFYAKTKQNSSGND